MYRKRNTDGAACVTEAQGRRLAIGTDRTDGEGNEITLTDILGTDENAVPDEVDRRLSIGKVARLIRTQLPERERVVLELRYGLTDGVPHSQKEVARVLGISRSYVSRIEKRALETLCDSFKKPLPSRKKHNRSRQGSQNAIKYEGTEDALCLGLELRQWKSADRWVPLTRHFHSYYVMGLIIRGARIMSAEGGQYPVCTGDMMLLNPCQVHACVAASDAPFAYRALHIAQTQMEAMTECAAPRFTAPS